MKFSKNPYLFLFLIILFSCSQEDDFITLQSDFEFPEKMLVGQSFGITEVTSGGAGYVWDFGNGVTSKEQHPQGITYMEPGIYTISLTVISTGKGQSTTQREVVVGQYQAYRMELLDLNSTFQNKDMSIYFTVNEIQTIRGEDLIEEEVFRSELTSGINSSNSLPLSFQLENFPLGGNGYWREQNPVIRFFDSENEEVVAANGYSIRGNFGWMHEFSQDNQFGDFISTSDAGGRIRVYYKAVYPQ